MQFDFTDKPLGSSVMEIFGINTYPIHMAQWVVSAPMVLKGYVKESDISYTHKIDESLVPAYFWPYFIEYMATLVAYTVTGNAQLGLAIDQKVEKLRKKALSVDKQSQTSEKFPTGRLEDSD